MKKSDCIGYVLLKIFQYLIVMGIVGFWLYHLYHVVFTPDPPEMAIVIVIIMTPLLSLALLYLVVNRFYPNSKLAKLLEKISDELFTWGYKGRSY